jgi:peroxiredoxin
MKTSISTKNNFTLVFKLMFVLAILTASYSCQKEDTPEPLAEGSAPEFTLTSLDGMNVKLSENRGKVVVLFFLGSSCPSCKAAAPGVQSMLVTPFANRSDYKILGLDQWNGNSAAVQSFKTVTGVTFPLLLNASGVASEYKTTYDRLVVVDQNGDIVFSGKQGAAADVSEVKQKVESLLTSMM